MTNLSVKKIAGKQILAMFQAQNAAVTDTQRAAIESGTAEFEASIFAGKPDWDKFHSMPAPRLTAEEQSFLDNEVEQLCEMVDDWEVRENLHDLSPETWDFLKENKFFGLIVPEKYEGKGFSELAHSEVLAKIATRSGTAAVIAMVPNSLGPAKLIYRYGTEDQKNGMLAKLAKGEEVPCFALTSDQAGSDATNIKDTGTVFKDKDGSLKIHLKWDKRYTTLAPIATVMGLAIQLKDPENHLGKGTKPGITLPLVRMDQPGIVREQRHRPASMPFPNGPHWGETDISADDIIGGPDFAGKGWSPALIDCLNIGRTISLPASAAGMARYACRATGGYAAVRQQFGMPLSEMGGVQESLARIGGLTYMIDAARIMPLQDLDIAHAKGEDARPAVASAILKYYTTEAARQVTIDAMDIHGGKAVMEGPNNPVAHLYQSIPVAITVEGHNLLTRNMMIMGQAIGVAHPYTLKEMNAKTPDEAYDLFMDHCKKAIDNTKKAAFSRKGGSPECGPDTEFYSDINMLSAQFATVMELTMLSMQGKLARNERVTSLLADTFSNLYLASQVLRRWDLDGKQAEDIPLMQWAAKTCLHKSETALHELIDNHPVAWVKAAVETLIDPNTRIMKKPSHELDAQVAKIVTTQGPARDRLTNNTFISKNPGDYMARLENAMALAAQALPHEKALYRSAKTNEKLHKAIPRTVEEAIRNLEKAEDKANATFADSFRGVLERIVKNGVFSGAQKQADEMKAAVNALTQVAAMIAKENPETCRKVVSDLATHLGISDSTKERIDQAAVNASVSRRNIYLDSIARTLQKSPIAKTAPKEAISAFVTSVGNEVLKGKSQTARDYAAALEKLLPGAIDSMTVTQSENYADMVKEASAKKIITKEVADLLNRTNHARADIVQVDYFADGWHGEPKQRVPAPLPSNANNPPKLKGLG